MLAGIENLASVGEVQKLQNVHAQNLKSLEVQLQNLKKKQENHCQLLKQKQKSDDAARRLEEEFYPSRHRRYKHDAFFNFEYIFFSYHIYSCHIFSLKMHLFDCLRWI